MRRGSDLRKTRESWWSDVVARAELGDLDSGDEGPECAWGG